MRSLRRVPGLLVVPVAALALDACGTEPGGGGANDIVCSTATFDIEGRRVTTFGTSADARKVDAFLRATIEMDRAVDEIHDGLVASCTAIGADLGLSERDYVAMSSGEARVQTVCRRVINEVRAVLQAALPAGASIRTVVSPAVCRVDLNVAAQCNAACTANAMLMAPRCSGTVVADCSGSCDAVCSGSCSAGCTGTCTGTCSGRCMGTCTGTCMGTCSQMDGTGRCIGTCDGACMGSCSANCTGSCMGSCTAGCMGSCMGQCRGMCSVASNVRCDGMWDADVEVDCRAACRAQANARAECVPPQVAVAASAMVNPQGLARLNALLRSVQRNYPAIARSGHRIQTTLTQTVPAFATGVQGATQAARNVGASAAACMVRAGLAIADVTSRFQASVTVTVEFSAALSVQGG